VTVSTDVTPSVVHLITRFLRGGAETTTENTVRALRDAPEPYELHLGFGASYDPEHVAEIEKLGVETHEFGLLKHREPLPQLGAVGEIALFLYRNEIDILHTHSTEAGVVGRFAAKLAGTPILIHEIHGDPVSPDRHELFNRLLIGLERLATAVTTVQVVKSERIRQSYLNRGVGSPEHYELIHHGVDIDRYQSATDDGAPPKRGTRLLYVGRLADGKGLFDLLSAVQRIDSDRQFDLLVVGDGPLYGELQGEIDQRELDEYVSLLGFRDDIPTLLASADVFVLPSYREGTPRVITEALAAGVPVVSTEIAGIPEQVRDGTNGHLVDPGDVQSLTAVLDRLLGKSDQRERLAANTDATLSKFAIDTVQRQYREFYRTLVDTRLS
jgi:glycosyltransferase involved in cell wall biosynthesis